MSRKDESCAYIQEEALFSQITDGYPLARQDPPSLIARRRDLC